MFVAGMKDMTLRFFFAAIFVAVAQLLPSTSAAADRPLVAIMGAYPPELVALRHEFGADARNSGFTTTTLRGVRFDRGVVDGREVLIFQAGASLVNAAYQLQLALDNFPIT